MVNQRLQDGGSSVLPTTQQLTTLPDSLPHPAHVRQLIAGHNYLKGDTCLQISERLMYM
jgi:hypothetical protein